MNSLKEKISLLRELGWSDELIEVLEKHEIKAEFGLHIENPITPTYIEEPLISATNVPPVYSTELVVPLR